MLLGLRDIIARNRKLIIITFEIFWIVIFLMHRYTSGTMDIPEFVYVNF